MSLHLLNPIRWCHQAIQNIILMQLALWITIQSFSLTVRQEKEKKIIFVIWDCFCASLHLSWLLEMQVLLCSPFRELLMLMSSLELGAFVKLSSLLKESESHHSKRMWSWTVNRLQPWMPKKNYSKYLFLEQNECSPDIPRAWYSDHFIRNSWKSLTVPLIQLLFSY